MVHHTLQIGNADTYSCICETSGNNYKHEAGGGCIFVSRLFGAAKFFLSFAYQKVHILIIEFKNDASCLNGYNIFLNVYSLDMNNGNKNINNEMVLLLIHKVPVSFIGVEIAYTVFRHCIFTNVAMPTAVFTSVKQQNKSLLMKYSYCAHITKNEIYR